MITSWRSPGTTTSRPSVSTRRPPGTPWANTATSLMRRDRSPSLEHPRVQLADEVTHPQPGQLRTMRHRSNEAQPALGQRSRPAVLPQTDPRRHAVDHAADHARVLARPVPARRDSECLGQAPRGARDRVQPGLCRARSARSWPLPASGRRPACDQQDVGVERSGQRLVESDGVQLGRARAERLDDDDVGSVMDRLPGGDDLLEHGVAVRLRPSCCSSWAVDSGSGGRSDVMAATSAAERSGPPSARG